MDEPSPGRAAALAGVLFVVLVAVGSFIAGAPPGADASAESLHAYFVDHHKVLVVVGVGSVALAYFRVRGLA